MLFLLATLPTLALAGDDAAPSDTDDTDTDVVVAPAPQTSPDVVAPAPATSATPPDVLGATTPFLPTSTGQAPLPTTSLLKRTLPAYITGDYDTQDPVYAKPAGPDSGAKASALPPPTAPDRLKDDPASPNPADEADDDDTTVVYGEHEVRQAHDQVVQALTDDGYRRKTARHGREVFVSEATWEPNVVLDKDGYELIRRRGLNFTGPEGVSGKKEPWYHYPLCVVEPLACVHYRGLIVSKQKLEPRKAEVADATHDPLVAYQDALGRQALSDRVYVELPEQLDAIWKGGIGLDGRPLSTPAERRAAIATLWLSRTDSAWGDAARVAIEHYVQAEVQSSPDPFTMDEIDAVNRQRTGRRTFHVEAP